MHTILITLFLVLSSGGTTLPTRDGDKLHVGDKLGTLAVADVKSAGSEVQLTLTPEAAKSFAAITRAHVGDKLAIVVGGVVQSAPVVRDPVTAGKVSITLRSPDDAAALARSLK